MKQKTIETIMKAYLDDWAKIREIATRERKSAKDIVCDIIHRGLKKPRCL